MIIVIYCVDYYILTNKAERYVSVIWKVIATSSFEMNQINPFAYQHCLSILLQRTMCRLASKVCLVPLITISVWVTRISWCRHPNIKNWHEPAVSKIFQKVSNNMPQLGVSLRARDQAQPSAVRTSLSPWFDHPKESFSYYTGVQFLSTCENQLPFCRKG